MSFAYHYDLLEPITEASYKNVQGVLSIEGEELLFEYKLYDDSGSSISTLNKYGITVDILKSIRFKKTLFNSYVIIETNNSVFLDPLPGSEEGKIHLKIKRNDRKNALDFCTKLNTAMSERRLRELDE